MTGEIKLKCSNCGKEQDALISMQGSKDVEDESKDMCFDCIKDWLSQLTFINPDGRMVRNGETVGYTDKEDENK